MFDIRDLSHPKEIAYFKPPAVRKAVLPGSGSWTQNVDRTYDKISGFARFTKVPANGTRGREMQIWFVSDGNGFQTCSGQTERLHAFYGRQARVIVASRP